MIDTGAFDLHQRLRVHGHGVGEGGQIPHNVRALLEVNPHRNQSYAGAHVLERQVEALPGHGTHLAHLGVELEDAVAEVHLGEALVSGDGVDLGELVLPEVAALVVVRLQVEEVEGLLAGAQDQRDGVAVPQGELQLHVDLLGRLARDPVGAEPVVLAVLHHVAHLKGPDRSVVLVHPTDLFPLKKTERGRGVGERQRVGATETEKEIEKTKYKRNKEGRSKGNRGVAQQRIVKEAGRVVRAKFEEIKGGRRQKKNRRRGKRFKNV